ncbi:hypothetical protein NP233_g10753 [Leucocoprinus birnbaumii]|uniref:Uncharacterized protein n=1 Tax=Leucocoprinus birnbaumii TaxID=56174 RepID=A0AAD5VI84_9AGAR|nr:hypothetical protein NP233_g10753 [Leucocoprinus birnbaumii]
MARGRKAAALPTCFEENAETNLVRCTLCPKYLPAYPDRWIARKSHKAHLDSQEHKKATLKENKAHLEQTRLAAAEGLSLPTRPVQPPSKPPVKAFSTGIESMNGEAKFWNDYDTNNQSIDMGSIGETTDLVHSRFEQKLDAQLEHWSSWTDIGDNEKEAILDPEDYEMKENVAQDTEVEDIISTLGCHLRTAELRGVDMWRPYPLKIYFLLDMVDTLPRLRISRAVMKVILWLLSECGVQDVPSYAGLRKMQESLREEAGVPTVSWKSPQGNNFSFNDPTALVANDWTNPLVAPHIRRYPVIPKDGVVSEIWHASKWRKDLDRHLLSPMYTDGVQHYYIDEPAKMKDGRLVVPVRWLENEADCMIYADAWVINVDQNTQLSTIDDTRTIHIAASELSFNMVELQDRQEIPTWSETTIAAGHLQRMPNPDRALAGGDPLYTSFIDVFGDDVSGNQSKSWNKHWNIYTTHRNLPREMLQQQYNVHFVSTSQHASVAEQFHGVHERIRSTHLDPIRVKCAVTGQDIRIKVRCNCGPGDNPSQSEICAHIGGNGNFPCRKCHIGGSQKDKETANGFSMFFQPGVARSGKETLAELEVQVALACLGKPQRVREKQSEAGVKDSSFTQYWIEEFLSRSREFQKENPSVPVPQIQAILLGWVSNNRSLVYNPYLELNDWDIARDTPVELLHTALLGVVKYLWHLTHTSFNTENKRIYATRLQATNRDGLSVESFQASYMIQYANSLIGRQLKVLSQVNIFYVYDLVDPPTLAFTQAVGELAALLWFPEIRNMEAYIVDVRIAVGNVLDCAAAINPSKIVKKIKYHYLTHVEEDIRRFGPLIGVMTENYESYNSVFRACSVLSNHLAPSRDIAHQLSRQETTKHVLSGGLWYSKASNEWLEPGLAVQKFIQTNPQLRSLHGWPERPDLRSLPGSVTLEPQKVNSETGKREHPPLHWDETQGPLAINQSPEWSEACWIAWKIVSILRHTDHDSTTVVLLDRFETTATRHIIFNMPVLVRRLGEKSIIAVPGKDILFDYNVQHDCYTGRCAATGQVPIRQERADTGATRGIIVHAPIEQYIINTHSFHNAHLVHKAVSHHLIAPIPRYSDRSNHHREMAQILGQQSTRGTQATTTNSHLENMTETRGSKRQRVDLEDTHRMES